MLILKNLQVFVNNREIIKNFIYQFEKNKVYAIMGPNGSGKSTLAYTIAGHPSYKIGKNSKILFKKKEISDLQADKRAKLGIFLSFQTPLSLQGVNVFQLLRLSLSGKIDPLVLKNEVERWAKKLQIRNDLINRPLNDGASGGEKKKIELLQGVILNPKVMIFDEIDTGVDVDALKVIAKTINKIKKDKIIIIITHYQRILRFLKPDRVLILKNGMLVKEGDERLAKKIDREGYGSIINNSLTYGR